MRNNFWIKDGVPHAAVVACINDVVLLDRTKIEGELGVTPRSKSRRYRWMVYDASNTKYFGEYQSFTSQMKAAGHMCRRAAYYPRPQAENIIPAKIKPVWDGTRPMSDQELRAEQTGNYDSMWAGFQQ